MHMLQVSVMFIPSDRFEELEEALRLAEAQQQEDEVKSQQLEALQEKLRDYSIRVHLTLSCPVLVSPHLWAS